MNSRSSNGSISGRGEGTSVSRQTKKEVTLWIGREAVRPAKFECPRYVRLVHEAVAHDDPEKPWLELLDRHPLRRRDVRHVARTRGHQHHLLVQHLVVPEVMQQGHGHDMGWPVMNTAVPGTRISVRVELVDEGPHRETVPVELLVQDTSGRAAR